MSVHISQFTAIDVGGEGVVLAKVEDGVLFIYPMGLGQGPMLAMATSDWERISREVAMAFMRADREETGNEDV